MDGAIEGIVLRKNKKNNKGHVDMVGISVLYVVKDLEDGQNLRKWGGKFEKELNIYTYSFVKSSGIR